MAVLVVRRRRSPFKVCRNGGLPVREPLRARPWTSMLLYKLRLVCCELLSTGCAYRDSYTCSSRAYGLSRQESTSSRRSAVVFHLLQHLAVSAVLATPKMRFSFGCVLRSFVQPADIHPGASVIGDCTHKLLVSVSIVVGMICLMPMTHNVGTNPSKRISRLPASNDHNTGH